MSNRGLAQRAHTAAAAAAAAVPTTAPLAQAHMAARFQQHTRISIQTHHTLLRLYGFLQPMHLLLHVRHHLPLDTDLLLRRAALLLEVLVCCLQLLLQSTVLLLEGTEGLHHVGQSLVVAGQCFVCRCQGLVVAG